MGVPLQRLKLSDLLGKVTSLRIPQEDVCSQHLGIKFKFNDLFSRSKASFWLLCPLRDVIRFAVLYVC